MPMARSILFLIITGLQIGATLQSVKVQTLEYVKFVLYILVIGGLKYRATTLWRVVVI